VNRGRPKAARAPVLWALALACAGGAGCDGCRAVEQPRESQLVLAPAPGGGWYAQLPDQIPKDRQVNCDICPYWCTQFDLGPVPMDQLIAAYRGLAYHYARDASAALDESGPQLERLGCIAATASAADRARFMALLADPDITTRYAAAVHSLGHGMATAEPLEVLRAIAASDDALAVDARIRVTEYAGGVRPEL
jgi:hypothetical protein